MINELMPIGDDKNDAFSRILAFYEPESQVVLTVDEDKILLRWLHCDTLIRSRKYRTADIIQQMIEKFSISRFTAEKDIAQTNALFGQVRAMSKQYVISHAIENLQIQIHKAENDKSLVHLVPALNRELRAFSALLPDEVAKKKVEIPHIHIGSLTINNVTNGEKPVVIDINEARKKWKERKAKKTNDDYIDHEDVK